MKSIEDQIRHLAEIAERTDRDPLPRRARSRATAAAVAVLLSAAVIGVAALGGDRPGRQSQLASPASAQTSPAPTVESPASTEAWERDRPYRIVDVTLEISQDGASVDAGSSQGLQPGVGVYDAGLIGVVQDTGSSSSTVRMLGSDELAVRASVVYAYGDDPDNGFASLVGTVKTVGSQLVFLADSPVPSERLSLLIGADVVVAGEAGSLLHPKVPIGTIERPVSADDTSSFVLALTGSLTASHATVILPESILMD